METEIEMEASQLPAAVSQTIAKQFAGYKIKEAVQTETPDKGKFYEVILANDKERLEVEISSTGTVLEKKELKKNTV